MTSMTPLRTYLMMAGITQAELCHATRLDNSMVSRAAKWGIASENVKQRIAEALGVPLGELFPKENE